jgi:hypothetical protein
MTSTASSSMSGQTAAPSTDAMDGAQSVGGVQVAGSTPSGGRGIQACMTFAAIETKAPKPNPSHATR